jgi:hypothetical protein
MTATPSALATWRARSFIADATPAFSSGTAPMTAFVAGARTHSIVRASPRNHSPIGR